MDQDVRIVFTAGTHWISRLIRWALRSEVSHVYIEYPSGMWGGRWAAEATKGGVRKVPGWKARHNVYAEFRCKFETKPGFAAVSKYLGEEYDYTGAVALGLLALLWRWFRVKVRHPFRSSKAQFCSEFVTHWLQGCEVEHTARWDVERSGPGRLYRFCGRSPEQFEEIGEKAA